MTQQFIHLHCHTEYSLLEGALRTKKLLAACKEQGMSSVAMTDNGCMFGTIDFYMKAKDAGINPIIGCEMYLTPDITQKARAHQRLVLLCKNYEGYQNLIKLVSISHLEGFYYKPRIDFAHLSKHTENLIAISPGMRGPVASNLQRHMDQDAKKEALAYKDIYGDDFYIGIQNCGLPFEEIIRDGSISISKETGIPLVATNDVYYQTEDKAYIRDIIGCIQTGRRLEDDVRHQSESHEMYFKSAEQMSALFPDTPEAISNTVKIANQCKVDIETDQVHLPRFECPDNLSGEAYLEQLVWEGIDKKYNVRTDEIKERVAFELGVINKMHYAYYFLIIYDFLFFCTENNIPVGPGRGSAAGSIVAYALNITKIDPIEYKLLFERFLNPERVSMPDVDLDFCIKRRGEVIDYIVQKYGEDCVSQIITFGTMQARAVIRDVGRVLDVPLADVDKIAKLIPASPGSYTSIPEALEQIAELKKLYDSNPQFKRLLDTGADMEGQARHNSTHAAGVVISRDPLTTVVPLLKNEGQIVTQYPMVDLETIGLLKMDILGLRNLTVISDVLVLLKRYHNVDLDPDELPYTDEKTYELLCSGETVGVFQLESRGMRTLIKDLKPTVFEDIIALLALYRPGPLGSGMVSDFISNKSGETQVKYDLDILEPILNETYGMIVYQEQVMQIASVVGGFSLGEADMLRRAMGKKKKDVMDEMKDSFLEGAQKKEIPAKIAEKIFELCYKFAEYGFNKSHSAAYALISYQTAYLKANYPAEYMAALMSSVVSSSEKTALYVLDCKQLGLDVLLPDVNHSLFDFSIHEREGKRVIIFGFGAIKNVGEGAIESIVETRQKGLYKDLMDFCMRVDLRQVNKRVVESLIKCGAFDAFDTRDKLLSQFEQVLSQAQTLIKERQNGQVGLFASVSGDAGNFVDNLNAQDYICLSKQELLKMEKEVLGLYISGHPLDEFKETLENQPIQVETITEENNGKIISVMGMISGTRRIITKTKKEMISGELEGLTGAISILLFESEKFEELAKSFQDDFIVSVSGRVRFKGDEISMSCDQVDVINNANMIKKMFFDMDGVDEPEIYNLIKKKTRENRGPMPVYFKVDGVTIQAHRKYWVSEEPESLEKFEELVGSGRCWVS